MKRKTLVVSFIVVIVLVLVVITKYQPNDKVILESNDDLIVTSNALSMMYETSAGSGEYQVSSDTSWPQEGYVFNERLSSCENGSTITWDDETKSVLMEANVPDK